MKTCFLKSPATSEPSKARQKSRALLHAEGEYKTVSIELAKAGLEDFNDRYKGSPRSRAREDAQVSTGCGFEH
jgi:hypothetical protein